MTNVDVSIEALKNTRESLIKDIRNSLTVDERNFLISITKGEPEWQLMPFKNIHELPALQWKIMNVRKTEAEKLDLMLKATEELLQL